VFFIKFKLLTVLKKLTLTVRSAAMRVGRKRIALLVGHACFRQKQSFGKSRRVGFHRSPPADATQEDLSPQATKRSTARILD
jgi:hypothetical protein